jgi:hypothetical protein
VAAPVQRRRGDRAPGVDRDVDGTGTRPSTAENGPRGRLDRDGAVVEDDDVVRAVLAQPRGARPVDGEPRTGAPAQRTAGELLHGHLDVGQPGQAGQLLADDGGLEPALLGGVDVLPVAAAAPSRPAVGTGPLHPRRRRLEHLDRVGAAEAGVPVLGHPHAHPLARQRVPDEDHPALVARHAVTAVRDRPDGHLELGAGPARTVVLPRRADAVAAAGPAAPVRHGRQP